MLPLDGGRALSPGCGHHWTLQGLGAVSCPGAPRRGCLPHPNVAHQDPPLTSDLQSFGLLCATVLGHLVTAAIDTNPLGI